VKIGMSVGNPESACTFGRLPHDGIGLARLEFVIDTTIGVHPKVLLNYATLDADTMALVGAKTKGYGSSEEFCVRQIVEGVAMNKRGVIVDYKMLHQGSKVLAEARAIGKRIAAGKAITLTSIPEMNSAVQGQIPVADVTDPGGAPNMKEAGAIVATCGCRPCHSEIIVRELGIPAVSGAGDATGRLPAGEEVCEECLAMELEPIQKALGDRGMTAAEIRNPCERTLDMAKDVREVLAKNSLQRGEDGCKANAMAELLSNSFRAEESWQKFRAIHAR